MDAIIASIAWVHRASLPHENVREFDYCGIPVINPYEL
jgi:predicted nucleic acid-binding protein